MKDLEQAKNWYSPAADAYNKARPRYPQKLISRAVNIAQLPANSSILEIGCGPGIATVEFAKLHYSIVCLEPNPDFCRLAQLNCASYPNVEIQQAMFEEWKLEPEKFNAILAATSIHWVTPEVRYAKTAAALQHNGTLILLWNTPPQPNYEISKVLNQVYRIYAPSLSPYEALEVYQERLECIAQKFIDSGLFKNLVSDHLVSEVIYSIDNYLLLLNTLSPYLALDSHNRKSLFTGLREKLQTNYGESIKLTYLSALHIAQKCH